MAARHGHSEPGPASSTDPDDDQRLSVELLMSQLVELEHPVQLTALLG